MGGKLSRLLRLAAACVTWVTCVTFAQTTTAPLAAVSPNSRAASSLAGPQPASAPTVTVRGRVVQRPGGAGIAGLQMRLRASGVWDTPYEATTDPNGDYAIMIPSSHRMRGLYLRPLDGLPAGTWRPSVSVCVGDEDVQVGDLPMELAQSISGSVTDSRTGKPLTEPVSLLVKGWGKFRTRTDGTYTVYVEPGRFTIGVEEGWFFRCKGVEAVVSAGQHVIGVDLSPEPLPTFSGRVLLPDGNAAAVASVSVQLIWFRNGGVPEEDNPPDQKLIADKDGRFTGIFYPVQNARMKKELLAFICAVSRDGSFAANPHRRFDANTLPSERLTISLVPCGSAMITVVDGDGNRVPEAQLKLQRSNLSDEERDPAAI